MTRFADRNRFAPWTGTAAFPSTVRAGSGRRVAESVALMIGATHDLDTASYTIPYVTSWASSVAGETPVEVVQATAERVRRTAVSILDQLETPQVGDGDPPGLDRAVLATKREAPKVEAPARREPAAVVGL